MLRESPARLTRSWSLRRQGWFSFTIAERDETGQRPWSTSIPGLDEVASALAQASDHILAFFAMLQAELAFYVGALNLREA